MTVWIRFQWALVGLNVGGAFRAALDGKSWMVLVCAATAVFCAWGALGSERDARRAALAATEAR